LLRNIVIERAQLSVLQFLEPPGAVLDGWPLVCDDPKPAKVREEVTEGIGYTPALEFGIGVLRIDRKTRKDAGFLFRIPLGSCRFAFEGAVPIVIASPQACYRSVRSRMPVLSATISCAPDPELAGWD